ncbi:MarR family winged helix-turn-helix transcriptional regulator [Pseudaestuariivita rosea]|uniref:MarR family winged helix-turn-helix transcriptional regulator n=1 Tax=Pseudaestuariivita rosea TaxID=2763263 RepID=UPI001ABBA5BF|nr:MarR family transcriptional regulator [Pseudaestuariivita rosea]
MTKSTDTSALSPEERMAEAVRVLLRAIYVGQQEKDTEETRLKLSVLERQLLGLLLITPGLMSKELAAYFGVQTTTMKSIIDRLIQNGMILKQPHPTDKRAIAVFLTDQGKEVIEGIRAKDVENCKNILSGLDDARQLQFIDDLEMMAQRFG